MSIKRTLLVASSAMAMLATTNAAALLIDFGQIAKNNEFGQQGMVIDSSDQANMGSLVVTASGYSLDSSSGKNVLTSAFAYLDHDANTNAGLGACKSITASLQCSPSSDDNVTDNEVLQLHFNSTVTIDALSFYNGGHGTSFDANALFGLSIGTPDVTDVDLGSFYSLSSAFVSPGLLTGTDFVFSNTNGSNTNSWVYYINTMTVTETVPEPSVALLLVVGLIGIGMGRRRSRL